MTDSSHSTAPRRWIEPLKRRGVRAPQRHSHHAGHPERDRVHRAEDLELPGCLCWAPVRPEGGSQKFSAHLLGYLQETHKWLLVRFSADRDTKATLRSLER
jgi:hypothetical protein